VPDLKAVIPRVKVSRDVANLVAPTPKLKPLRRKTEAVVMRRNILTGEYMSAWESASSTAFCRISKLPSTTS
jgi:hypothetical protein